MLARVTAVARCAALVGSAVAVLSCTVSVLPYVPQVYYGDGAEAALELLHVYGASSRMRVLAVMEAAMIRLELGDYDAALLAARAGGREIEALVAGRAPGPGSAFASDGTFIGQPFERRWLKTVAVLASLARQDAQAAAADASALVGSPPACGGCEDPFSRYVAAAALDAAGKPAEALAALEGSGGSGPAAALLAAERVRIGARDELAAALRYLPPRPEGARRELVVLLLLGQGPARVSWPDGGPVSWEGGGSTTTAAEVVEPGGRTAPAVILTDLERLARAEQEASEPATGPFDRRGSWPGSRGELYLPHWTTLPATAQAVRLEPGGGTEWVELRFLDADGRETAAEAIELPEEWTSGPLFVVRRVP